jgi:bacteriocin-like protein
MVLMKKISLKGISEVLSEKELKNVLGGSGSNTTCSSGACNQITLCSFGSIEGTCKSGSGGCTCQ